MKQLISAGILLLFTLCILLGIHSYLNYVPEFEELSTFDPSRYPVSRQLQEFKIKPNDRQWFLSSFRYYDGEGVLEREELYEIDENGVSYYIAPNGNRIDSWQVPDTNELTDYLETWNVSEEQFDRQNRITVRTAYSPLADGAHGPREILHWYYCPGSNAGEANAICSYIRTMHLMIPPGEETFLFGDDNRPIYEKTSYEIMTFDKYGNNCQVWIEGPCYLVTDLGGYLQMVFLKTYDWGTYIRVDELGRPVWQATYYLPDKTLLGYSLWTYEDLSDP